MCGIAGEIRFDGKPASAARLAQSADSMAGRGPDGDGLLVHGPVGFAHRRLRIMDLSEHAQQPMVDSDLGLSVVFNGAIYNHHDLRAELTAKGYRFFSTGDTEVLLKGYHAWGEALIEKLQGMFAFALWERDTGRMVLARDRLGIKPLYYAEVPGAFYFASTLPALLCRPEIDRSLDPVALHNYLTFHSVVPAPRTILNGVRKLPPATVLTLERDGTRRERRYWALSYEARDDERNLSAKEWEERVLASLRLAVKRRLVADVPVGVLLSGGVDSSLLVGLLAEQMGDGLRTFSVGFEAVNNEAGDEFQYSDLVAQRFATKHEKLFVSSDRVLPALRECISAMSEPMVSHDNVGFYLLSELVSKHVRVVQSGQGADEVFGGYHWYPPLMESRDPVGDYARVFFDSDHAGFLRTVHPRFAGADHSRAYVEAHFAQPGAERGIDKALRLDTTVMLVDDPVKRVDNQTMAFGLEARVPFLDHELVELAARIPPALKVGGDGKHILKEASRQVIPSEVIDRPKGYFPVPALKYLQGPFLGLVNEVLTDGKARQRALFQTDYVAELMREPERHITPLRGSRLWQVALLELWLQTHRI